MCIRLSHVLWPGLKLSGIRNWKKQSVDTMQEKTNFRDLHRYNSTQRNTVQFRFMNKSMLTFRFIPIYIKDHHVFIEKRVEVCASTNFPEYHDPC